MVFDKQGNLYGVLQDFGGILAPLGGECGAVYRLSPPAQTGGSWTETLLYEFQGKGANDGESPNSGLIMDKSGNLYGLTAYGGTGNCLLLGLAAGCGTVYKLLRRSRKGARGRKPSSTVSRARRKVMYRLETWYSTAREICTDQLCLAGRKARPATQITVAMWGGV